jgi:hypothetical protein
MRLLPLSITFIALAFHLEAALCAPAASDPFAGDTRLDQPASLSIEGMALSDLMSWLSAKSGVSLSTARALGDEKVVVFTQARPLRQTLKDIASLFNFRWERRSPENQVPTYQLTSDRSVQRYDEELLQRVAEKMLSKLEAQVRGLRETPDELNRRDESDDIRKRLSTPDTRLATEFYGLLGPDQKRKLFSIGRLRLPFRALPERHKQVLRQMAARSVRANLADLEPGALSVEDYVRHNIDRLEATGALFKLVRYSPRNYTTVWLSLGSYGGAVTCELTDSGEWQFPPHGNPYPRDEMGKRKEARQRNAESRPAKSELPLIKDILSAANEDAAPDRLRALSRRSGQSVIGDYYRTKPHAGRRYPASPPDADEKVQALNDLANKDGSLWWSEGQTLFFRSRSWYERRLYEVPDSWLLSVSSKLKSQKGKPTYDDLQRLAELTPLQIQGLMSGHRKSGDLMFKTEFDVYFQPGLHELLALLKPKPWPFRKEAEIVSVRLSGPEEERSTLTWGMMSAAQRAIVPAYLHSQDELIPDAPLDTFSVFIRTRNTVEVAGNFASVGIICKMSGGVGNDTFFDRHADYDLFLPLALPDDRRSKNSIEIPAKN